MDNSLSAYWYALSKETPGKAWWRARAMHDAVFRALRIDRHELGAIYAAIPFRLARIDDKPVILAAYPAPRCFAPIDENWLNIESVLAWDPVGGGTFIMGDPDGRAFGALDDGANQMHTDPLTFFQTWASRRAAFAVKRQALSAKAWTTPPSEHDEIPGALLIGALDKVKFNPAAMPQHIECVGLDPRDLNRAILRAARLPRATASASHARRAA